MKKLSTVAMNILKERVFQKNETKWEDVCKRVASVLSAKEKDKEKWNNEFYKMLLNMDFLPNSPTLMNAGRQGILSACLVLPIEDSLESIFGTLKDAGIAQSYGAGCISGHHPVWVDEYSMIHMKDIKQFKNVKEYGKPHKLRTKLHTISYNIEKNVFEKKRITHLWKFKPETEEQLRVLLDCGWLGITAWHPFFVLREEAVEKVRADELKPGDKIVSYQFKFGLDKDCTIDTGYFPEVKGLEHNFSAGDIYYDFTVEDNNNYIAWAGTKAVVISNTGFNFSNLRPRGSAVSDRGETEGPCMFLQLYDFGIGKVVKQAGKRQGANMGAMHYSHADIEEFVDLKKNKEVDHFNISVIADNKFMEAVEAGKEKETKLFNKICENAWYNGDPGLLFIDAANKNNPLFKVLGELNGVNPCGETWLYPYEMCNLGSINLVNHLKHQQTSIEKEYTEDGSGVAQSCHIDKGKLSNTVHKAVRLLDNVIDCNYYPIKKIEEATKANRKIGLGIMGFADMLIELDIVYGSKESIAIAKDVMKFINEEACDASSRLAEEKGVYPNWSELPENRAEASYEGQNVFIMSQRIRNAVRTVLAPAGTLSLLANVSSGIEPNPSEVVIRKDEIHKDGVEIEHPLAKRKAFMAAHDVHWENQIKVQAALQQYTENAVSKTVNMRENATVEDVKGAYMLAWQLGCKGVTVYRDKSREEQVLTYKEKPERPSVHRISEANDKPILQNNCVHRPNPSSGYTYKYDTGKESLYVTLNECEGIPVEMFLSVGKSGARIHALVEAIGRLISLIFKYNNGPVPLESVVKQLKGITSEPFWQNGEPILSLPDAIGRLLEERFLRAPEKETKQPEKNKQSNMPDISDQLRTISLSEQEVCSECGVGSLRRESGRCKVCDYCSYNSCG